MKTDVWFECKPDGTYIIYKGIYGTTTKTALKTIKQKKDLGLALRNEQRKYLK
tara:strand:- start:819 stop:977 length:159 start_codon:yes stop_codon:yes gene_type:complete